MATAYLSERTIFFTLWAFAVAAGAATLLTVVDFGQVIFSPLKFLGAKTFPKVTDGFPWDGRGWYTPWGTYKSPI